MSKSGGGKRAGKNKDGGRRAGGGPGTGSGAGRAAAASEAQAPAETPESGMKKALVALAWVGVFGFLAVFVWAKYFREPFVEKLKNGVPQPIEKPWTSLVDGPRALDTATRLCALGPRVAGSDGSRDARRFITYELNAAGITDVREQSFKEKTPVGEVEFTNLIGVLPGKRPEAIALGAHYDSKFFSEFTFIGANDAASAVALNLEIARHLVADRKVRAAGATSAPAAPLTSGLSGEFTVYFVFFDGEEAFNAEWGDQEDGTPDHTYGSRHMAARLKEWPIKRLILTDMIGEKDLQLVPDHNSSPDLLQLFVETSKDTFGVNFFNSKVTGVVDDHVPFVKAGVPSIDLIDFEYGIGEGTGRQGHWHTAGDTIDKLHPRGFEIVGTLVLKALPKIERKLKRDV